MLQKEGRTRPRVVPSKDDYHPHCVGNLNDDALARECLNGGYYNRYTLRDFYPQGLTEILGSNPYPEKKTGAGYPYAALRRGFRALGTRAKAFPDKMKHDLRQLSDLYDREPKLDTSTSDSPTTRNTTPSAGGSGRDGDIRRGNDVCISKGRETEHHNQEQSTAQRNSDNDPNGDRDWLCRLEMETEHYSAGSNRLSQASTLADNEVKYDKLSYFQKGSNHHVVRKHDYRCRNNIPRDAAHRACRACIIEKYDSMGIQYLPVPDEEPASLAEGFKYPGLEPAVEPAIEWRYGPKATSQEALDAKVRMRFPTAGLPDDNDVVLENSRRVMM